MRGWSPFANAPACISAARTNAHCITLWPKFSDNSMDEAVAGHANRIEVTLHSDYAVTIRDNGRGIPD